MDNQKNLNGLSGWLVLVGFGLVFSLIRLLYISIVSFSDLYADGVWTLLTSTASNSYIPYWGALVLFELTFNIFSFVASSYLIYLFFKKNILFPKTYIFVALITVVMIGVDILATMVILPDSTFDESGVKEFFRSFVGALIWVPYMLKSKRVKNTFTYSGVNSEVRMFAIVGVVLLLAFGISLINDQAESQNKDLGKANSAEGNTINDVLAKTARQINKNLPMLVDEETRLDLTIGLDHYFMYKYTLLNYRADELDSKYIYGLIKPALTENVCTSDDMKIFIELNVPVEYLYYGNDGKKVTSVVISSKDCT